MEDSPFVISEDDDDDDTTFVPPAVNRNIASDLRNSCAIRLEHMQTSAQATTLSIPVPQKEMITQAQAKAAETNAYFRTEYESLGYVNV